MEDVVGDEQREMDAAIDSRLGESKLSPGGRSAYPESTLDGRGEEKSQPPSDRRRAMRIDSPGVRVNWGISGSRPGVKGVTRDAGCERSKTMLVRPALRLAGSARSASGSARCLKGWFSLRRRRQTVRMPPAMRRMAMTVMDAPTATPVAEEEECVEDSVMCANAFRSKERKLTK